MSKPASPKLMTIVEQMLAAIGEDPQRKGLLRTPERVANSLEYLVSGHEQQLDEIVNGALFEEDCDEMVLVRDIEFYSLCEHHMLPFYGRINVAYIPDGKVIGLSKLPRIVDMFARRLQVQERMTVQIANAVQEVLGAKGVAVVSEASHLCMMMRGVAKQASSTTTSCMLGAFRDDARTRSEFMSLTSSNSRR
ncbi:MAG TPA: GTP cyclohydrolase I FolE [Planctomycetes bacterium]|jgi:GTP cyclohydrolase I|nr:GTP cyclohydrolase I FolE [Planctomycetota bacterium]